jgi:hypothetical protein
LTPEDRANTEEILTGILGEKSSWELYGREHRTPMSFVLAEAEQALKGPINLYWVDGRSPEIFCLKGRSEPVVVFSTRFLEIWGDLRGILTDRRPEPSLKKQLLTEHLFRLIAEYALSMDDPEFAGVASINAALLGQGIFYLPNTLQSLEYEPISIRYMCCWFFALCHEIGHFADSTIFPAEVSDSELMELVQTILSRFNFPPELISRAEQDMKGDPDRFILGMNRIRSEFRSDLFASVILFVCTQNILAEVKNSEKFSWIEYLSEVSISLALVSLIDRCRRIAVFSCTAEPSDNIRFEAILQPTAISVRLSMLYRRFPPLLVEMLYGPTPSEEQERQFSHIVEKVLDSTQDFIEIADQSLVEVYRATLDRRNRGNFTEKLVEYRERLLKDSGSVNNIAINVLLERAHMLRRHSQVFESLKKVRDDPARPVEFPLEQDSLLYLCVGVEGPGVSSQIFGIPTRYGYTVFIFTASGSALFDKFLELSRVDLPQDIKLTRVMLLVRSPRQLRYAVATRVPVGINLHLVIQGKEDFSRYINELSSGEIFDLEGSH